MHASVKVLTKMRSPPGHAETCGYSINSLCLSVPRVSDWIVTVNSNRRFIQLSMMWMPNLLGSASSGQFCTYFIESLFVEAKEQTTGNCLWLFSHPPTSFGQSSIKLALKVLRSAFMRPTPLPSNFLWNTTTDMLPPCRPVLVKQFKFIPRFTHFSNIPCYCSPCFSGSLYSFLNIFWQLHQHVLGLKELKRLDNDSHFWIIF